MNHLLTVITNLLPPPLRPFAKSVWPLVASAITAIVVWADTGTVDGEGLALAVGGIVAAVIAYLVPNQPPAPVALDSSVH